MQIDCSHFVARRQDFSLHGRIILIGMFQHQNWARNGAELLMF